MQVSERIVDIRKIRSQLKEPVGFVPTMGYLHEGHLSLVKQAREENESVVVSIFVNPTQFGPREDFRNYPRDTDRDLAMLAPLSDVVFMPPPEEMYPENYDTWVLPGDIAERLEGAARPGHFRGVATVVIKLFNIVQPARAYFGQKDAQQVAVVRKIVTDLDMNLQIVSCPTFREPDGLAMSSRNTLLSSEHRQEATVLYRSLERARELWERGEKNAGKIRLEITELIEREPSADISYVSIAHPDTLKEMLHRVKPPALVSLAVKFGRTRLIDNVVLE